MTRHVTVTIIHDAINHPVIVIVVRSMQYKDPTNHQAIAFFIPTPVIMCMFMHGALKGMKLYLSAGPGLEPVT